ncbi:MAG: hypothetical protein ACREVN_13060 [Gammaproteobacteria bacterium]
MLEHFAHGFGLFRALLRFETLRKAEHRSAIVLVQRFAIGFRITVVTRRQSIDAITLDLRA